MSLKPAVSLALSVHAHRGIYALLLGSGISRSAGIPTGWEIVKDLIRRIAVLEGPDPGEEAESWYRKRFAKAPSYSELIAMLAPTAPERASLLRAYFEPTEQEKETGLKVPTPTHQAIARLVSREYIRIIITTNFDRLMERALEQENVSPIVVSSADHIEGMMPLPHVRCLVFKIHGDYLDTRIKNTPEELEAYDEQTNDLLDRILTEYGLIISGWSGEWDIALAHAILRTTRHRFSTYWMARGRLTDRATDLIKHRQAQVIEIDSADQAFIDLEARIEALEAQRMSDPLSPRLAIATMKKYLAEDKYRIQLEDFVVNELNSVSGRASRDHFPYGPPEPTQATYLDRIERMEAICGNLVPIVATGVYWGTPRQDPLWKRCIETLARSELRSGTSYTAWSHLHYYPATLVLYAAGIAALAQGRHDLLRLLLEDSLAKTTLEGSTRVCENEVAAEALVSSRCFPEDGIRLLPHSASFPEVVASEWLAQRLRPQLGEILGEDAGFDELFDELELIIALVTADRYDGQQIPHVPVGRFRFRFLSQGYPDQLIQRFIQEVSEPGRKPVLLEAGLFNGDIDRLKRTLRIITERSAVR